MTFPWSSPTGYSIVDVIPRGPHDLPGIEKLLGETVDERARLEREHATRCERYDTLMACRRERTQQAAAAQKRLLGAQMAAFDDAAESPVCNYARAAELLRAPAEEYALLQNACDLLEFVRIPEAQRAMLESARDLKRMIRLEAELFAARSAAEVQAKSVTAFGRDARVAVISEETQFLEAESARLGKLAHLADQELSAFIAKRESITQQSAACGITTRAESVFTQCQLSEASESQAPEEGAKSK